MNRTPTNNPAPGKVRYSAARRLSIQLFFRLLGIYVSFDILLCFLTGAALLVYCEQTAASAAEALVDATPGRIATINLSEDTGVIAVPVTYETDGFRIIKPFSFLLPRITAESGRSLSINPSADERPFRELDTLSYDIYFRVDPAIYKISVQLGAFLRFSRYVFTLLLIFQLLSLLSRYGRDKRNVRDILNPISELAEAAKNISRENHLDSDKIAALAGKLESINASRLDTRIQVDDTQEELRNIALAINGMLDRINEAYRAQVRFVSDASHELRTPISVIQGYANLLDRWGKNDEKALQESITAIKDEAASMKDLVEQLLFLARGDNNTIKLQLEEVSLPALAEEAVFETQLIDTTHHFELRTCDAVITADRALIKQALRILIDNAIKYTDPNGNITVSVERAGDSARLSVSDDGIGIEPEILPYVFDRFYRADESRAKATGGAGLGLSIAKWIVSRHGGHMEVLSRLGIGTRIIIALSAHALSAPAQNASPVQKEETPGA